MSSSDGLSSINNYSLLSSPLTTLLKNRPKSLSWNPPAIQAFQSLKEVFLSAPILVHPYTDPWKWKWTPPQILSFCHSGRVILHTSHQCAFYSKKVSPVEHNFKIGNHELLMIKLTLEEWIHWLEGANHRFKVITDHQNLEYLQEAKRLNPHQARCAMFSTRFDFIFTYRPLQGRGHLPIASSRT